MTDGASFGPGSQGSAREPATPSQPAGADPSRERDAIVRYLLEEADDCMRYLEVFGESDLAEMGVMRAGYYRQAAAFIKRGEHLRLDRPRPTWTRDSDRSPEGEDA